MIYNNIEKVISKQELFLLLQKDGPYNEEELQKVNNYFDDIMKMIKNKNPGYEERIKELNAYLENLQVNKEIFTERENDFMARCYKLYDELEKTNGLDKGTQLTLRQDGVKTSQVTPVEDENNNYGFSSPEAIIILISSIVVVLSIIVISLF